MKCPMNEQPERACSGESAYSAESSRRCNEAAEALRIIAALRSYVIRVSGSFVLPKGMEARIAEFAERVVQ